MKRSLVHKWKKDINTKMYLFTSEKSDLTSTKMAFSEHSERLHKNLPPLRISNEEESL